MVHGHSIVYVLSKQGFSEENCVNLRKIGKLERKMDRNFEHKRKDQWVNKKAEIIQAYLWLPRVKISMKIYNYTCSHYQCGEEKDKVISR